LNHEGHEEKLKNKGISIKITAETQRAQRKNQNAYIKNLKPALFFIRRSMLSVECSMFIFSFFFNSAIRNRNTPTPNQSLFPLWLESFSCFMLSDHPDKTK